MDQLVDFLWFDVKRYWELSAATEITWSSALNSKALYNATCSKKFIYRILKLLVNIEWLLFPLILWCPNCLCHNSDNITSSSKGILKGIYDPVMKSSFKIFHNNSRICCRISNMYSFQQPHDYILSEHWKGHRLLWFICPCLLVCCHSNL